MTESAGVDQAIREASEEVEKAYAENIEKSNILFELTREKSEAFKSELWRGLLAINGAGLAASATILSTDGFPSVFLKVASFLFFLGLIGSAYCWGLDLGYSFWSRQLASQARIRVENGAQWVRARPSKVSARERWKWIMEARKLVRRVEKSRQALERLQYSLQLVPSVGLWSGLFFAFGATLLIVGLMMYDPSKSGAEFVISIAM